MLKEERERKVFELFATASGLLPNGIFESRRPNEPDILYIPSVGRQRAFELVEILDSDYSRSLGRHFSIKNACSNQLESLPTGIRRSFQQEFHDADIYLGFKPNLSKSACLNILPKVFDALLALPSGTTGPILSDEPKFHGVLDDAFINRERFKGSLFDSNSFTWVGDPTVDAISSKMGKKYAPDGELNLLAYIDGNPMFPNDVWLANLDEYLGTLNSSCQFQHIYVFDCGINEVHRIWHRNG